MEALAYFGARRYAEGMSSGSYIGEQLVLSLEAVAKTSGLNLDSYSIWLSDFSLAGLGLGGWLM